MSLAPTPSTSRGDLLLQPPFFTSSLFVNPFRADVASLIDLFAAQYRLSNDQPFALFKRLWQAEGWPYMHLKVFDARTRDTYLKVACRLLFEKVDEANDALHRVAALFALYTFYSTQPTNTHPPLLSIKHVDIAMDTYASLVHLPKALQSPELAPLVPYVVHIVKTLTASRVFYILPSSTDTPYNPRSLPREIFVSDDVEAEAEAVASTSTSAAPKKKGRPSKRDIAKKTREAVVALDKWLDRTSDMTSAEPRHSQAAKGSRAVYVGEKTALLDGLGSSGALERANAAVLARLKKIDAMAAEKGMEVGSEGGEKTGLGRVERAVGELGGGARKGGILGLLEGAGMS
ncbi:hypothetical protein FA95DRAFT_1682978 [Auriscalpium vulgare]|uniref:Uncharacterized protein n=1 Tax=Auriscalpium vulgare TaxID=40419 RepID=A0ACB8RDZ7_9AGAM|nr:hypothetical protein FA95DRAFT_1682978 [Auriscalpium vulgare]